MPCCKAKEFLGWCENEEVVFTDEDGKEYCLFHAPKDHKGMSVEEFKKRVFQRIRETPGDSGCNLSYVVFPGDVNFGEFDKDHPLPGISFVEAQFRGEANFLSAQFSGLAHFRGAQFSEEANFFGAQFGEKAVFQGARFGGLAHFGEAQFSKEADFGRALFSRAAEFIEAQLGGVADFGKAQFSKVAYLGGAQFGGDASFLGAQFGEKAVFQGARFGGLANFGEAQSSGTAHFNMARFEKETSFLTVKFGKGADFSAATFLGLTQFQDTEFHDMTFFRSCFTKEIVRFENVDFTHVSFLENEIELFKFVRCRWPRKAPKKGWWIPAKLREKLGRYQLMDEKLENPNLPEIEALYRGLKRRAKAAHDEPEVCEWHYCEKEIARKRGGLQWPIIFLYWLFSGYGERPLRAGCWLVGWITVLTLLMGIWGLQPRCETGPILIFSSLGDLIHPKLWGLLFLNTLQHVLFLKDPAYEPIILMPDALVQIIFTRILIPLQFALFAFALRNKFRR